MGRFLWARAAAARATRAVGTGGRRCWRGGRVAGAAVVAVAIAGWPGPAPLAGWPGAPGAAPVWAGDDWCEVDPLVVIRTPGGRLVPVYYVSGALGLEHAATLLLATKAYTAEPAGGKTWVTVRVTVPDDVFGTAFPTRLTVSEGPLGTLTVYDRTTGTSGSPMTARFFLDVP
jgi:hypothetical protein